METPISKSSKPQERDVQSAGERATLVKALSIVAVTDRRTRARRFLQGLSTDELRYIASYLGACLLESDLRSRSVSRDEIAWEILQYEWCRKREPQRALVVSGDVEHKMILLLEYLSACQCGAALKVAAGSA